MRNLGLLVAFWLSAILPTSSFALGLGEIEVNSFLNQPLNAEIEVVSARPGEIDDLLVSLASREAFSRAGLARPQHLTELQFEVIKNEEDDSAVIQVSTRGSIKEPFLNFLIEADWSKGRLLREFTVLLDPPFYAEQPPAPETTSQSSAPASTDTGDLAETDTTGTEMAAAPAASDETITEPIALSESTSSEPLTTQAESTESTSTTQMSSPPASEEYVADESENIIEGDVLVVKDDTLWSIASHYKREGYSMSQVMLAFQRANPDAFGDGNINNLKEGAVLRAPSAEDMDAYDQQSAYAEVLTQNGLWDEYVARVTGVSPAMAGAGDGGDSGQVSETEQGELSLLMPEGEGNDSTGTGDSADLDQLRSKLALAEEDLEASRIENADLESRIVELQARVSKFEELQSMIEIEDDSLAQIQDGQTDDLAETGVDSEGEQGATDGELSGDISGDESTATQPEAADAISESMEADEEALLEELLAEEAAAQAEEQAAQQVGELSEDAVEEGVSDEMSSDEMASDEMQEDSVIDEPMVADADSGDLMADDDSEPETTTAAPPAPVIVTEPKSSSGSMLDGILPASVIGMISSVGGIFADPIILAALGGVIVLLLILVIVKRRKAAKGDDSGAAGGNDDLFASDDEEELTPIHLAESEEAAGTDVDLPSSEDMASEEQPVVEEEEDEFGATAIVSASDLPEPEQEAPASTPASSEQDDVLNEVDVYLAYGLYDNAEDLLKTSLAENPDRGDYRSKLLDTYFATKNATAFVEEAQNLKSMGDASNSYWDRVQIMGYELAPDNALFSDAKDSGLSAADLEIAKPQEADFDLGGDEKDDTNFSSADFHIGDEEGDGDFGGVGDLDSTQQISLAADADSGSDDDDLLDLPDDIGEELEFSMDEAEPAEAPADELDLPDDLDFDADVDAAEDDETDLGDLGDLDLEDEADLEIPDAAVEDDDETDLGDLDLLGEAEADLDIASDDVAESATSEDESLDFDMDDAAGEELDLGEDLGLDDALELDVPEDGGDDYGKTEIITPNYEETAIIPGPVEDAVESADISELEDESSIDLGMEDTAMKDFDEFAEEAGGLELGDDDEEDISIIDFGGEDFVEPTDVIESLSDDDIKDSDDEFALDDDDSEETSTGTFAPGDFEESADDAESLEGMDDMDDLLLPDDVDEVSTKLDLARAFIDMGDTEGARGSLEEVMSEGNAEQKEEAKSLLDQI